MPLHRDDDVWAAPTTSGSWLLSVARAGAFLLVLRFRPTPPPMDLLTLAPHLAPVDGVQRAQLDVCRTIADRGHRVSVLAAAGGANESTWSQFTETMRVGVPLAAPAANPVMAGRTLARLAVLSRSLPDFDLVYCHRVDQVNAGALVSVVRRVPLVFHAHNAPPGEWTRSSFSVPGARRVRVVLTASRFMGLAWRDAGFTVATVPYGVDTDRFAPPTPRERAISRSRWEIPQDDVVVGFIGRIEATK